MTPVTNLSMLRPGDKAIVEGVNGTAAQVRRRLLELGLTKGVLVEFIRMAPLGDPIEVRIKDYRLSLRRIEAEAVFVRKEN